MVQFFPIFFFLFCFVLFLDFTAAAAILTGTGFFPTEPMGELKKRERERKEGGGEHNVGQTRNAMLMRVAENHIPPATQARQGKRGTLTPAAARGVITLKYS